MVLKNSFKKMERGFTLIELITVIAILALMTGFIVIRLTSTNDDAKLGISKAFLKKNIPQAISSYQMIYGSCQSFDENGNGGDLTAASEVPGTGEAGSVAYELAKRGAYERTTWEEDWFAQYDHTDRTLYVFYPTLGATNPLQLATDLSLGLKRGPAIRGVWLNGGAVANHEWHEANFKGQVDSDIAVASMIPFPSFTGLTANYVLVAYSCL